MSLFEQYTLIIATFLTGTFLVTLLTKLHNRACAEVILGVMHDVPVSTEVRWIWLFQVVLSFSLSILVLDFFLLFVFLTAASAVAESVAPLAYLAAAIAGFAFILQLLFGTSSFLKLVSILRQSARG